jgi:hypothetical protein
MNSIDAANDQRWLWSTLGVAGFCHDLIKARTQPSTMQVLYQAPAAVESVIQTAAGRVDEIPKAPRAQA